MCIRDRDESVLDVYPQIVAGKDERVVARDPVSVSVFVLIEVTAAAISESVFVFMSDDIASLTIKDLSNLNKSPPIKVPHVINVGYFPTVAGRE